MPISRLMDKENVVYIHRRKLLSYKNEWNLVICSNIDELEDILLIQT